MAKKNQSKGPRQNKHASTHVPVKTYDEYDIEDILSKVSKPFILVLDCVQDPHNLGACIRTANAVGAHLVIIPYDKASPITETVTKIACGAAHKTPIARVTNISRTLDLLHDLDICVIGTSDRTNTTIYEQDLNIPLALVLGAEGMGIRKLTGDKCDHIVKIPMHGDVECLNVSVATGVCLFEASRQRSS